MKWSIPFIRLMISVLLLTILWNGCAQGIYMETSAKELPLKEVGLKTLNINNSDLQKRKSVSLDIPSFCYDVDVFGLRFQPEQDPNIYLTWSHRLDKVSTAEVGWSVNYFTAVTIKYNLVFSLIKK